MSFHVRSFDGLFFDKKYTIDLFEMIAEGLHDFNLLFSFIVLF